MSVGPPAPLLGNCLINPVCAKGKDIFGFEIGETLVLHYSPEEADAGYKKFVGKPFTCSVVRYKVKKAAKERGGKVVANNGDIQMTVPWEDAPADYKVRGKGIIGLQMDFTLDEFKAAYKVHKREKPRVVGGQGAKEGGDN